MSAQRRRERQPQTASQVSLPEDDHEERVERLRTFWRWLGVLRPPASGCIGLPCTGILPDVWLPSLPPAGFLGPARHVVFSIDQEDAIHSLMSTVNMCTRLVLVPPTSSLATTEEGLPVALVFDVTEKFRLPASSQAEIRHQPLRLPGGGINYVNDPLILVGLIRPRVSIWKWRPPAAEEGDHEWRDPDVEVYPIGCHVLVRPLEDDFSSPSIAEDSPEPHDAVLLSECLTRVKMVLDRCVGQQGVESFTRCHGLLPRGPVSQYVRVH